jgi:hypothetical protein
MLTTGELCIIYGIISFKIWLFYFCNIFLVDASQKNPFLEREKWKMSLFYAKKMKTLLFWCYEDQTTPYTKLIVNIFIIFLF